MRLVLAVLLGGLIVALGAACGDDEPTSAGDRSLCAGETRADTFSVGMEKPTQMNDFTVRLADTQVEGAVSPPDRGNNTWTLEVLDASRARVRGATVTMRPWMPDHGHGTTPLDIGATEADGVYSFGPFDLFMGGFWEFGVRVQTDSADDRATFGFCLEG